MVAVAAVVIALVLFRQTTRIVAPVPGWASLVLDGSILAADFLAPFSFAIVVIRLRRPRPSIRRLARQGGFAACLAASVASGSLAITLGIVHAVNRHHVDIEVLWFIFAHCVGFAVLGAWVTLAATGRWRRPVLGVVERAGWLVGWGWLSILGILWVVIAFVH